jgi:hypothetical protein
MWCSKSKTTTCGVSSEFAAKPARGRIHRIYMGVVERGNGTRTFAT